MAISLITGGLGNNVGQSTAHNQPISVAINAVANCLCSVSRKLWHCLWFDVLGRTHARPLENLNDYHVVLAGPAEPVMGPISAKVALGCGCYWGTEKFVTNDFQRRFPQSIKSAKVGFMSPYDDPPIAKPTYEQVCSGRSGHVEVLFLELQEPEKHFEELCRFMFQFHDPTQRNRQGNDRGFQYGSCIFCDDETQQGIAEKTRRELQAAIDLKAVTVYLNREVMTKVTTLQEFKPARQGHQEYLQRNPDGYCNHQIRFKEWYALQNKGGAAAINDDAGGRGG